jgi:hypothetical protein
VLGPEYPLLRNELALIDFGHTRAFSIADMMNVDQFVLRHACSIVHTDIGVGVDFGLSEKTHALRVIDNAAR